MKTKNIKKRSLTNFKFWLKKTPNLIQSILILTTTIWAGNALAQSCHLPSTETSYDTKTMQSLKLNQKIQISEDRYLLAEFVDKPKMGMIVLRANVLDKSGSKTSNYKITGSADMPSMRGHHNSGDTAFKINQNGDYLLPVNLVMPGDWEVVVKVFDNEKEIYLGQILFDI